MCQIFSKYLGSKKVLIFCHFSSIILYNFVNLSEAKDQYVQPLNMGMQVAIPYDIGNIFNRPINFSIVAAILSAASLLYLLFFGVITAPFGYFFGVPSEKYVMGDAWETLPGKDKDKDKTKRVGYYEDQQYNHHDYYESDNFEQFSYGHPRGLQGFGTKIDFEEQIFSGKLGTEVKDVECRKMLVCEAHAGLRNLPHNFVKIYQFFSKKLLSISVDYREAILNGITSQENCQEIYSQCNDSIFGILVRGLVKLMPKWSRKKTKRSQHNFM